jgi:hypothetical protein
MKNHNLERIFLSKLKNLHLKLKIFNNNIKIFYKIINYFLNTNKIKNYI